MNKKSTSRWIVIIAWLLSLAAMFLLGTLAGLTVRDGRSTFLGNDGKFELLDAEAVLYIRELTGREPNFSLRDQPAHVAQLREAFSALNGLADPLELRYKARALAAALNLQELLAMVQHMEQLPQSVVRTRIIAALLERWGGLDPRSAIAYSASPKNALDHEGALLSVLEGWAHNSPLEAWNWVLQNTGSGVVAEQRVAAVVLRAAQRDPQVAFRFAVEAPASTLQATALQTLLYQQMNRERPRQVARWLDGVPAGPALDQASGYLAGEWARHAPTEAAEWAQQREVAEGRSGAIAAVASSWAQASPGPAAAWVASLPPGPARADAAAALADAWLDQGGTAQLARWLNSLQPHSDFDPAIAALAREAAPGNPSTALSWASTIESAAYRESIVLAIGREWLAENPQAAREGIRASNLDAALKRLLTGDSPAPAPVLPAAPAPEPATATGTPTQPQAQPPSDTAETDVIEAEDDADYFEDGEGYFDEDGEPVYYDD